MSEKEIMQWAIEGIKAEITKQDKRLRYALSVQAHKKDKNSHERTKRRIAELREDIELLSRKKAFLIVQLEERG